MKFTLCLSACCLLALLPATAQAAGPWPLFDGQCWNFPRLHELWRKRDCWCPDDYCPKPLPDCLPIPKGCGDDYCAKPLPFVPANAPGCGCDYRPKCCPLYLWLCAEPWYRCGPVQEPCPACRSGR